MIVLMDDRERVYDVPAKSLPKECREEGAVLDVPLTAEGGMDWAHARRNREEEAARLRDAQDRLDRLRAKDPGGDVEL